MRLNQFLSNENPDIIFAQEHWLTPANLNKFEVYFSDFFAFGVSAMSSVVESDMLRGRPFSGVITLIKIACVKLLKLFTAVNDM